MILSTGVSAAESWRERVQDWLATQGYGADLQPVQISVFGDGVTENGIEDSRIDFSSPHWNDQTRTAWNTGAGSVYCDGRNRGSAVILDTTGIGLLEAGFIVASSAHVLFDLELMTPYQRCHFHYMAIGSLPGYQAEIDLTRSRVGQFDPASPRTGLEFGQGDWAFLWIADPAPGLQITGRVKPRSFASLSRLQGFDGHFEFIAFNPVSGNISISTRCEVRESAPGDLGGGAWKGQLLDNCDSEGGASGGGLIANIDGESFLVGIRSGAHWDGGLFPAHDFPDGPPRGARWDVRTNTNFSRAIDPELLAELRSMIQDLNKAVRVQKPGLDF